MKPTTKEHHRVFEVNNKLKRKLSPKIIARYTKKLLPAYCTSHYNKLICMDCNKEIGLKKDLHILSKRSVIDFANKIAIDCPHCKIPAIYDEANYVNEIRWVMALETFKEYQLVRIWQLEKDSSKYHMPKYYSKEIIRHFINEKGKITTLSMPKTNGIFNRNISFYEGEWQLLNPNSGSGSFLFHETGLICKKPEITEAVALRGYLYSKTKLPHITISNLLKSSYFETIYKHGDRNLIDFFDRIDPEANKVLKTNWSIFKQVMKHNYSIGPGIRSYLDYIQDLIDFNKDIHNPKYLFPKDWLKEHRKYTEKRRAIRRKEDYAKQLARMKEENIHYTSFYKKYFDLRFYENDLEIVPFTSVKQFMEEGDLLNHCIYENSFYKKHNTLLFSVRKNNKVAATAQISLNTGLVLQSYGKNNKKNKAAKLAKDILEKNKERILTLNKAS